MLGWRGSRGGVSYGEGFGRVGEQVIVDAFLDFVGLFEELLDFDLIHAELVAEKFTFGFVACVALHGVAADVLLDEKPNGKGGEQGGELDGPVIFQ